MKSYIPTHICTYLYVKKKKCNEVGLMILMIIGHRIT